MQILTKKQVKYCRLVTKKSAALEYCLGIEFQDKLFITDKFFAGDRRQLALDYCQNKYLAEGGSKSYLLVANVAGLTVWQEDKIARIVGKQSPQDFTTDLKLDSFILQMQNIGATLKGDRQNSFQSDQLVESFKLSLTKIVHWEQMVRDGYWLKSVKSGAPFNIVHHY